MAMRTIAHLDLDAFYVSVELQRRPELRGRPVVVAGRGPRAVVTTASYEARRFGVESAVPAARARRLCPDAVFVEPDFDAYRRVSAQVMDRVRATVPTVEVAGLDEAYLDLTGLVAPRAAMRRLVADIGAATGLGASVGIGPSKLVAKVASDAEKPAGFVVLSREQACARFAAAAPSLLPGIGPKTATALQAMGVTTIASLAATPVETLASGFGARLGPYLHRRARFEDDGSITPVRTAVSESRETTFAADISDPAELERVLRGLSQRLCGALRGQGRRGRTVAIKVRLDDFSTHTRARTLAAPIDDGDLVGDVACELLRAFSAPRAVRLLGVRIAGFEPAGAQPAPQLALPL
jgi:DNA polymerase-4